MRFLQAGAALAALAAAAAQAQPGEQPWVPAGEEAGMRVLVRAEPAAVGDGPGLAFRTEYDSDRTVCCDAEGEPLTFRSALLVFEADCTARTLTPFSRGLYRDPELQERVAFAWLRGPDAQPRPAADLGEAAGEILDVMCR